MSEQDYTNVCKKAGLYGIAGYYPSILRVEHPAKQYQETIGGAFEKDADPSRLRFFDRVKGSIPPPYRQCLHHDVFRPFAWETALLPPFWPPTPTVLEDCLQQLVLLIATRTCVIVAQVVWFLYTSARDTACVLNMII